MGRNQRKRKEKRRQLRSRGWSAEVFEGPPVGPDVVTASLAEVMSAMETVSPELAWDDVAESVVPLFQRVRPYPPAMPEPLRIVAPPGLSVAFGIDIGPAFLTVTPELVGTWGLSPSDLLARALANLEWRMRTLSGADLVDGLIGDVPVRMLQSPTGAASTYVLAPGSLGRILGRHPQLVIAPMRNLLISMPVGTNRDFALWLFDEFAAQDPNCLAPAAFVVGDGQLGLEPLGESFGVA